MDIIINPTNKCNFCCEFCAASNLPNNTLTIEETIELLKPYGKNIGQLVINGGDPLCMDPQWYLDLIKYLEDINCFATISLTTNLWDYHMNPKKWLPVLRNHRIGVITSFQFGTKRKISNYVVFDKKMFIEIENQFYKDIGYTPSFISVIDYYNEPFVRETIDLCKQLNTRCKINKAVISGRQRGYYPRYRLYQNLFGILERGDQKYEMNTKLIMDALENKPTICPLADSSCYKNIKCINPDGNVSCCGYASDNYNDEEFVLAYEKYKVIKPECYGCKYYRICNSCHIYIKEVIDNHDEEKYCDVMFYILEKFSRYIGVRRG